MEVCVVEHLLIEWLRAAFEQEFEHRRSPGLPGESCSPPPAAPTSAVSGAALAI